MVDVCSENRTSHSIALSLKGSSGSTAYADCRLLGLDANHEPTNYESAIHVAARMPLPQNGCGVIGGLPSGRPDFDFGTGRGEGAPPTQYDRAMPRMCSPM